MSKDFISMFVCVCVCVFVCVCLCVCMCVSLCVFLCLCISVCVFVYWCVCMFVSVWVCECVAMCICVCKCVFVRLCVCAYLYRLIFLFLFSLSMTLANILAHRVCITPSSASFANHCWELVLSHTRVIFITGVSPLFSPQKKYLLFVLWRFSYCKHPFKPNITNMLYSGSCLMYSRLMFSLYSNLQWSTK